MARPITVAVAQATPVMFDQHASIAKACDLITRAGEQGARLILFPEAFLPGYPRGLGFGMVVGRRSREGRDQWLTLWEQSVEVPGPVVDALREAAQRAGVATVLGVIERDAATSRGTLYCSLLFISAHGDLLGVHRKLKPTGSERLIWGEGDGASLLVYPTEHARIGGLICWENYMPLARLALYRQGVEVYLAPTADARETWLATLRHIACEGRCFVLGCNQYVARSMYPADWRELPELVNEPEVLCRGGSVIVGPLGEVLAGPVFDREELLVARLDLDDVTRAKLDFDVVGHYARDDVFGRPE